MHTDTLTGQIALDYPSPSRPSWLILDCIKLTVGTNDPITANQPISTSWAAPDEMGYIIRMEP